MSHFAPSATDPLHSAHRGPRPAEAPANGSVTHPDRHTTGPVSSIESTISPNTHDPASPSVEPASRTPPGPASPSFSAFSLGSSPGGSVETDPFARDDIWSPLGPRSDSPAHTSVSLISRGEEPAGLFVHKRVGEVLDEHAQLRLQLRDALTADSAVGYMVAAGLCRQLESLELAFDHQAIVEGFARLRAMGCSRDELRQAQYFTVTAFHAFVETAGLNLLQGAGGAAAADTTGNPRTAASRWGRRARAWCARGST